MNDIPEPQKTTAAEPTRTAFSKVLGVLAYPIAAVPGIFVAKAGIREAIYDKYAGKGGFADLQNQYAADFHKITGIDPAEVRSERRGNNKVARTELKYVREETRDAVAALDREMFKAVEKKFAEKWNMHNVFDYWKNINANQKINTAFMALTVSGVALGALLTIANSRTLSKLGTRKGKDDDPSPGR